MNWTQTFTSVQSAQLLFWSNRACHTYHFIIFVLSGVFHSFLKFKLMIRLIFKKEKKKTPQTPQPQRTCLDLRKIIVNILVDTQSNLIKLIILEKLCSVNWDCMRLPQVLHATEARRHFQFKASTYKRHIKNLHANMSSPERNTYHGWWTYRENKQHHHNNPWQPYRHYGGGWTTAEREHLNTSHV